MDPQAEKKREGEKIKQIDKCLDELTYYVDTMLGEKVDESKNWRKYNMDTDDIYEVVDGHLFSLACYMRREDDREYLGQNNNLTNKILNGVRPIKDKLKARGKETGNITIKAMAKHIDRWLTKHNMKWKRNKFISSKKCDEKMPAYLLKAITKEKPVHPVYGNLRY